jgi:hypothetical protein
MKSYTEYLIESTKVYEFKIKIAGDIDNDCACNIKHALARYNVESCSTGKNTPIQESPVDFPEHKNVTVTIFDVSLTYPVNSSQVREAVAQQLKVSTSCVKVRNLKEQEEECINHKYDTKTGESLLGKDYESTNNQKLVGEEHAMSLLKELTKAKHELAQYKGVNDQLLATSVPDENTKGPAANAKKDSMSTIGGTKVKLPKAKGL